MYQSEEVFGAGWLGETNTCAPKLNNDVVCITKEAGDAGHRDEIPDAPPDAIRIFVPADAKKLDAMSKGGYVCGPRGRVQ